MEKRMAIFMHKDEIKKYLKRERYKFDKRFILFNLFIFIICLCTYIITFYNRYTKFSIYFIIVFSILIIVFLCRFIYCQIIITRYNKELKDFDEEIINSQLPDDM